MLYCGYLLIWEASVCGPDCRFHSPFLPIAVSHKMATEVWFFFSLSKQWRHYLFTFFFLLLFYFLFWLCISFETLFYSFRVIVLSDYLSSADIQRAGTHRCIKNRGERIEMFFLFLLPLLLIATTRQTRRRRRQPNVYDPQSSAVAPSFSTRCQKIIRTYTTQLIQRIVTGCEPHPTPPSPNKNLIRKGKEGKDVDDKTDNGIGRDIWC